MDYTGLQFTTLTYIACIALYCNVEHIVLVQHNKRYDLSLKARTIIISLYEFEALLYLPFMSAFVSLTYIPLDSTYSFSYFRWKSVNKNGFCQVCYPPE